MIWKANTEDMESSPNEAHSTDLVCEAVVGGEGVGGISVAVR